LKILGISFCILPRAMPIKFCFRPLGHVGATNTTKIYFSTQYISIVHCKCKCMLIIFSLEKSTRYNAFSIHNVGSWVAKICAEYRILYWCRKSVKS
jgi:hypothetical protein